MKQQQKKKKRHYHDVRPDQKVIIRTAKRFSLRGAYVYVPVSWLGRKVEIRRYYGMMLKFYKPTPLK